jgi:hypothetical protein
MMAPALEPSRQFDLRAHPNLYEINTWAWLEQLSARAGREINLASVPDSEWDSFAQLGFDIVWLMGVWQRSPESRRIALADPRNVGAYARALPGWTPADVVGSPYAVKQYVPDPRIGTWDDLDRAREKLREQESRYFLISSETTRRSIILGRTSILNSTCRVRSGSSRAAPRVSFR